MSFPFDTHARRSYHDRYIILTFRNIAQRGKVVSGLIAAPPAAIETYVRVLQVIRAQKKPALTLEGAHKSVGDELL